MSVQFTPDALLLLIKYTIIAAIGAVARTLITKERFKATAGRMVAGLILGPVIGWMMRDISWSEPMKELVTLGVGAFADLTLMAGRKSYEKFLNSKSNNP